MTTQEAEKELKIKTLFIPNNAINWDMKIQKLQN